MIERFNEFQLNYSMNYMIQWFDEWYDDHEERSQFINNDAGGSVNVQLEQGWEEEVN